MKRASVIIVGMHNAGRALLSQKLFLVYIFSMINVSEYRTRHSAYQG